MLAYFKITFILTVIFIVLIIITNIFTTIKFVNFTIVFCIAVSFSFFIEYYKVLSRYLLFTRKYF
ncbi:hypothetical protein ACAN_0133 [Malaciobacter canalis]|nr:hypothetical protein ACAN_0133 [Malaciobacter canalis]